MKCLPWEGTAVDILGPVPIRASGNKYHLDMAQSSSQIKKPYSRMSSLDTALQHELHSDQGNFVSLGRSNESVGH